MAKKMRIRLVFWAAASALLAVLTVGENWPRFKATLTCGYVVAGHHVAPWGVLGLCLLWLYLQRKKIRAAMDQGSAPLLFLFGLGVGGASFLIPPAEELLLLKVLAGSLGLFALFFKRGAVIPFVLLGAYAFTIFMPVLVQRYLEVPYARTSVVPAAGLLKLTGLPVVVSGQVFHLLTPAGQEMAVLVSSGCAGPATMAVFIAIFTLMTLDLPLPWKRAAPVFLLGVLGTWLQNVLRILIILACGCLSGEKALWTAHFWTIYILFPLWYLAFSALYFHAARRPGRQVTWKGKF